LEATKRSSGNWTINDGAFKNWNITRCWKGMSSYKAMRRREGNWNDYYGVEEANLKMLHSVWVEEHN
jgi:hypothetical protein